MLPGPGPNKKSYLDLDPDQKKVGPAHLYYRPMTQL
jgi:hypothetical protein